MCPGNGPLVLEDTQMTKAMVDLPTIVDSHVHHWDPANLEWYPILDPEADLSAVGLGDTAGLRRIFDQDTYLTEASAWPVEAYVHVSAAMGPGTHLGETVMLEEVAAATGKVLAILGTVDPSGSAAEIAGELDMQLGSAHFRGIRILELDYTGSHAAEILELLEERSLVYDLVVHPDIMLPALKALEPTPDLSVVVEHAGWPRRLGDETEEATWRAGITALAERENTVLKFSGLPMVLHNFSVAQMKPWFEHCVESFGAERCMFGSNFPVDGLYGTLSELWTAYRELALPLGPAAESNLFADTARRTYSLA